MSKKLIFCLLLGLIYAQDAVAFNTTTYTKDLRTAWGVPDLRVLKTALKFHCKGLVGNALNSGSLDNKKKMLSRKHIKLYLAREIYEKGAYFCATWVTGHKNYWDGHAYIKYIEAQPADCFYACEAGYYGRGCASKSPTTCLTKDRVKALSTIPSALHDTGKIENYVLHGYKAPVDVTDQVAGFYDFMKSCFSGFFTLDEDNFKVLTGAKDQQHHVTLAVTGAPTISDKGVVHSLAARPVIIRAGTIRNTYKIETDAWVRIGLSEDLGAAKHLYLDGAIKNSTGNFVVDENSVLCQASNLCSATPKGQYKSNIHKIIAADEHDDTACAGKQVFRCKSGAFKATGNYSCVPCNENIRKGPNNAGVCIECPVGKKYDSYINGCIVGVALKKTDMMFGIGKTDSADLEAQCWAKDYKQDYIDCIKGINKAVSSE